MNCALSETAFRHDRFVTAATRSRESLRDATRDEILCDGGCVSRRCTLLNRTRSLMAGGALSVAVVHLLFWKMPRFGSVVVCCTMCSTLRPPTTRSKRSVCVLVPPEKRGVSFRSLSVSLSSISLAPSIERRCGNVVRERSRRAALGALARPPSPCRRLRIGGAEWWRRLLVGGCAAWTQRHVADDAALDRVR